MENWVHNQTITTEKWEKKIHASLLDLKKKKLCDSELQRKFFTISKKRQNYDKQLSPEKF